MYIFKIISDEITQSGCGMMKMQESKFPLISHERNEKMDTKIDDILKKMTNEQKIALCTGETDWMTQHFTEPLVESFVMSDGTNGVRFQEGSTDTKPTSFYDSLTAASFDNEAALNRTIPATCFPTGSALACSWNTALAQEIGRAVADECTGEGIHMILGPGMNIRRHPLTGRGFEYYSEDPCLSGEMAAAMVQGIQENGAYACIKHFCANNSDSLRTIVDSVIDERALREIYLAGFERAVKQAKPAAVMNSYNLVNGVQASENTRLLTNVLRDEWGFEGIVISDWGSVKNSVESFKAGLDLHMPHSERFIECLQEALESGVITQQELDEHCRRMLRMINAPRRAKQPLTENQKTAHHQLARRAALESAVLLKNDGILPIDSAVKSIAVLGALAQNPIYQGTGCAIVNAQKVDIPYAQLQAAAPKNVAFQYAPGYENAENAACTNAQALLQDAVCAAQNAEIAIVFVGASLPLESDDYNRTHLDIDAAHLALLQAVSAVQKNVVVVVMSGESVVMPWIRAARAVLLPGFGGEGAGYAVAQLLFGKANPSGKLAVTMPKKLSDTPAFLSFPGENHRHVYSEEIFVGYRYYDTKETQPLFSFGHGLSYTCFQYSAFSISPERANLAQTIEVRCTVTNTGTMQGKETVQLYVRDKHAKLKRPDKELKGFLKVDLAPKESKTVSFTLSARDFQYYDPAEGGWVAYSGEFMVLLGGGSRDLPLEGSVYITGNARKPATIMADTHFCELFQNEAATQCFFDFLVRENMVPRDKVTPLLKAGIENTFWGIAEFFEMYAPGAVTRAKLAELVQSLNNAQK